LQFLINCIYALLYILFALYINYNIVLIAISVSFLIVWIQKTITKRIIRYSNEIVEGNEKTNLIVLQILNSMKYLISTNSSSVYNNYFNKISKTYSINNEKISFLNSIPKNTPEIVGVIVISLLIIINEIYIKEELVQVVFIGLILYRSIIKILSIQKSHQDFLLNIGSIDAIIKLEDFLEKNKEINSSLNNEYNKIDKIKLKNNILEFNNVKVLKGINLELEKDKIFALVGKSGSGKSSILNILTLLYKPINGEVLINNKNIMEIDKNIYRSKIGYVSQECVIFDGTIEENIIFGKKFDKNKYDNVIKELQIDKIEKSKLNMGGTNISGGQRQLIAFAREIYKNPEVLILDEFTSALDSSTERIIMNFIEKIKQDKIILIVAHRLSSIINTDKVFFMENGLITDSNKFEILYNKNSKFMKMCNNQNIYL
jgi:ABC-type multidrug transport system fused ATPase/permease subunit